MKIIVKRFCLSHNGEIYKAGDVVEIEDPKTAKRLVARSGGTLEIYNSDEVEDVEDSDNGDNEDSDNEDGDNGDDDAGDGGVSDDVSDSDSEDGAGGIPAVDPAAAVRTDNTSPKGKGRGKGK
ncbi:hypothetical protein [uncultured Selenomonas sp.]|uniref:hypothetical protein n=1 Tax=uncultured Selenomonas sp. TaxID=159275 RepID=UPI0028E33BED|nr:hypothetical protein [uncultured Selenomonas sp.]